MQRRDADDEQLERISQRLRSERPQLDPLRLDEIKTTAMSRAQRGGRTAMRRRLAVAALTLGLMAAGTGGVIAAGGASQSSGNAATAQYGEQGVKGSHQHRAQTRSFHIRVQLPRHAKLKRVTIKLNGKTVLVLSGHKATTDVSIKLPCSKGTVEVIAVTTDGRTFTQMHLLLACPKK